MHERGVPIDPDAFVVHQDERYIRELGDIMEANGFLQGDLSEAKAKAQEAKNKRREK